MSSKEAADQGTDYVAKHGYQGFTLQAVQQVLPNIWCVRFGMAPDGSGKGLELHFDAQNRTLMKSQEVDGMASKWEHLSGQ
jgi:hypothetical protein